MNPLFGPMPQAPIPQPRTFEPQISDIGQMLDMFAQRRMQQDIENRRMRAMEAQERRFAGQHRMDTARFNQSNLAEMRKAASRGVAQPFQWMDESGNIQLVNPKLSTRQIPGQPQTPQAQPAPQTPPGEGGLTQEDMALANQLSDPELSQQEQPQEQAPAPLPQSMIPQALGMVPFAGPAMQAAANQMPASQSNPMVSVQDEALMSGATAPLDESFAQPQEAPMPQEPAAPPTSSTAIAGPSKVRRYLAYSIPGQGDIEEDLDAGQDYEDQRAAQEIAAIDAQLKDPSSAAMAPMLLSRKLALQAGMSKDATAAMYGAGKEATKTIGIRSNLDAKLEEARRAQQAKFDQQNADREDRQEWGSKENEANRQTRRETSKWYNKTHGGGGGVAKAVDTTTSPQSAFYNLDTKAQNAIISNVERGMNRLNREFNWNKFQGGGIQRLRLALENIRAGGPMAGTQNMEAMFNFFGYIRGGVPALNESREWHQVTNSLWTTLNEIGKSVGVNNLGSLNPDNEEDKAKFGEAVGRMNPGQRKSLEQAIMAAEKFVRDSVIQSVIAQSKNWELGGGGTFAKATHEKAQAALNAKLNFAGWEPMQFYEDTPLVLEGEFTPKTKSQALAEKKGGGSGGSASQGGQGQGSFLQQLDELKRLRGGQ